MGNRRFAAAVLSLTSILHAGCTSDDPPSAGPDSGGRDAGSGSGDSGMRDGAEPADAGVPPPLTVCSAPDGYTCREAIVEGPPCEAGGRACFFRVIWNDAACADGARCGLTVLFAGGDAGCPIPASSPGYFRTAMFWARNGFVFVCAQPFYSASETEAQLYSDELPRIRALVDWAQTEPVIVARADPTALSVQGISHGGYNVLLNYVQADDTGHPTHLVIYDAGGDIGRTEATLYEAYQRTGDLNQLGLHHRFVRRANLASSDAAPGPHPSSRLPFCAGQDDAADSNYRRDSADWSCTSDEAYLGTLWGCDDVVTAARWRFFGCDLGGELGPVDVPDHEVQCSAESLASCGVESNYVDFPAMSPSVDGVQCDHTTCMTWACAAPQACEWIRGIPCT